MFLFTYGSLRPSLSPSNVARFNLKPIVGKATLSGKLEMVSVGWFPALIPCEGWNTVVGELVEVSDLTYIDQYEGYQPNGRGLYDREELPVFVDGKKYIAWVYFMHRRPHVAEDVPGQDWANR